MGLKPDHWIRKMALEHGMIEPFVENQVREGVVSYGVSSYGYDMRIADEYKIFTNVQSAIVDPKNFTPNSFVDFKGEVCIIPPNSFVLARSIEYFRIPRSVLAICLGKCVTGDTRIVDTKTGAYISISEAAELQETLSLDACWNSIASSVSDFIPQGKRPVYALKTRLGLQIKATANHPFRQLNGWTELKDLKIGDRIAVARSVPIFGNTPIEDWEAILLGLMIAEGQCDTPGYSPTFTTDDTVLGDLVTWCSKKGFNSAVTKVGRYSYRLVNRQGRGGIPERNRAHQWLKSYGLNVHAEFKFVPQAIFTAPEKSVALFIRALFSGDGSIYKTPTGFHLEYYSNSKRLIEDVHHLLLRFGIFSIIREKQTHIGTTAYRIQITDREQILLFADKIGFLEGSKKQQRLLNEVLPAIQSITRLPTTNFDTLPVEAWEYVKEAKNFVNVSLSQIGIPRVSSHQSLPYSVALKTGSYTQYRPLEHLANSDVVWDTVKSVEYVGEEEVYDITVPHNHNFLANDIYIHNSTYARCGLLVNITPFEPEFEGHITIEISNTTPLPAKIYSNEGISQVLFFEADEECEVSYADKKGKYQGQTGVTPPRL